MEINTVHLNEVNEKTGLVQITFEFGYLDKLVSLKVYKSSVIHNFEEYGSFLYQVDPDRNSECSLCGRDHSRFTLSSHSVAHVESVTLSNEEFIDMCKGCCSSLNSQLESEVKKTYSIELLSREI